MKCKNAPSTPPIRLHETLSEKEITFTNDPSTSLSATASATATAVPTASADVDTTLFSKRYSRVAQHSSQPGYWRIVMTCREVLDLCGVLCTAKDPLNTSIRMVGWRPSAGGCNSAPVDCSNSVHSLLPPCPSISDILAEYLDVKYGIKSEMLSRERVSHFRQAVMRYSRYHPVVKLFCIFLSLSTTSSSSPPSSSSSSSSSSPSSPSSPGLVSSNAKRMDGLESMARGGADIHCQHDGGVCDNGDEEILFLLSMDCRQRMASRGALVSGTPIRRELHTLSGPHALESTQLTDALPSPLSSSAFPLMPAMQLVPRYLL
jgi:hypothetical protein